MKRKDRLNKNNVTRYRNFVSVEIIATESIMFKRVTYKTQGLDRDVNL